MLVDLKRVTKRFRIGSVVLEAVRAVDFAVSAHEFVVLHGASGSGKTTLLNLIGLLARPDEGQVLIQGADASSLPDKALAKLRNQLIGFVFQNFNLVPTLDAVQNVMLPLKIRGTGSKEARERAVDLLEALGLGPFAGHRPGQLSGGQKQRVAIARALVGKPAFIIADEPTANLDSRTATEVVEFMRRQGEDRAVTFLMATHDERLFAYAKRLVRLQDGRIVEDSAGGPPR